MHAVAPLITVALTLFGIVSANAQPMDPARLPSWKVPDLASLPDDDYGGAAKA